MYASSSTGSGSCSTTSASLCHHDYSTPQGHQQPLHIGIGVQSPPPDHSLHGDFNLNAPSPNSLTMYEQDQQGVIHGSLSSSCGSEGALSPPLDFDLKPQFEYNDDSLFKLDLAALNSSFGSCSSSDTDPSVMFKMEDVFQEEKNPDIVQGPTLAELNFENSVVTTVPGGGYLEDLEGGLSNRTTVTTPPVVPSYTSTTTTTASNQPAQSAAISRQGLPQRKHPWNTTSLLTAFLARPSLRSFSSQTSPPTTHPPPTFTVSSPNGDAAVPQVMIKHEKGATPSTCMGGAPGAAGSASFEVTGSFSLVPDTSVLTPNLAEDSSGVAKNLNTSGSAQTSGQGVSSGVSSELMGPDTKSALAELLTQMPAPVGGVVKPVQVKTEGDQSLSCQKIGNSHNRHPNVAQPTLTLLTPMRPPGGAKRSLSPDDSSNSSAASVDRKWEEIKQFIYNDEEPTFPTTATTSSKTAEPLVKKIKTEPEDVAYNPVDVLDSEDMYDSDVDVDNLEMDCGSDAESIGSFTDDYPVTSSKREKRYFWQYNTQSKGPKGKRLCKSVTTADPHVLASFEDPVFDPELNQSQYKHNGKARRGDGNDITPSPGKLFSIGKELKKLNRIINDMTPPSELPSGVRPKTRKEKNKLASRACRLKKKAQHEANKVKLFGLEREHQKLMQVLEKTKWEVSLRMQDPTRRLGGEKVATKLDKLIKKYLTQMIAGNTTDFVNSVLLKVTAGDKTGGLDI